MRASRFGPEALRAVVAALGVALLVGLSGACPCSAGIAPAVGEHACCLPPVGISAPGHGCCPSASHTGPAPGVSRALRALSSSHLVAWSPEAGLAEAGRPGASGSCASVAPGPIPPAAVLRV